MQSIYVYHINNVPVHVRNLPSGDIAVWHPINPETRAIVERICRDSGRWHTGYNNWIVFKKFKYRVLYALGNVGGAHA